jgi:hypothetical protein
MSDCIKMRKKRKQAIGTMAISSALRSDRGNMIALLAAITLGLVLVLLIFALRFTRFLGSNQEQRTAIEAAALAAANDISRITIDDPNFGMIALSDFAPVGFDTVAVDKQPTPVRGINTVLATVRVDMIIADQFCRHRRMVLIMIGTVTRSTSTPMPPRPIRRTSIA